MIRRSVGVWLTLVALGWFWLIPKYTSAQDKKPEETKAAARAPAPAQAPAAAPPAAKPDPSGVKTGDETFAQDGEFNTFIPADPGAAPEKKDFKDEKEYVEARKAWDAKKKDFDEYTEQSKKEPLAVKLAKSVGHNRAGINMTWILVCGMLVMFMQAGFALVETGLCRAKNAAHTMAMNFLIYPLGMLGFYVCGFAFMFGGAVNVPTVGGPAVLDGVWSINGWNILGTKGFFLTGSCYDASVFAIFFFQMVFMDTTATIPTGACAERWKFSSFVLYGVAIGTVMYPIYGNWVWGGGWCSQLGAKLGLGHGTCDFAGSSVVHLQGGVIAFWFAKMLGPRVGKYNKDGTPNVIPAHNIPMVMLGTFILAFGWFGFNPGGSLAGTDLRNAMSVVNTMLASATGAMATTLWMWKVRGNKPDPSMMCNGMLAGLVAITAPCAYVNSVSACIIGLVSGILVVEVVFLVERKLKIDDPVGAIAVHGSNGLWGILSVGLFADGTYPGAGQVNGVDGPVKGLFYGDAGQLAAQAIGAGACIVYLTIASFVVFKVVAMLTGGTQRPPAEVEVDGLDIPEVGCVGYCGIVMDKSSESPISK
ncbi:MAG TPA: ammonium transporter [Planctomycetota bacterium]|nr:ammonium transporter [Planctomycetota bacterium]